MLKRWNRFFYRNSKIGNDPDSTWKLQNEQMKTNEVYKLVNFAEGGTLIDAFDEGGVEESYEAKKARMLPFIKKEIEEKFLSHKVHLIDERQYRQFLKREEDKSKKHNEYKENNTYIVEIGSSGDILHGDGSGSAVSLDSVLSTYNGVECYWDLHKRGGVGETALHMLFVNNTPKTLTIAKMLLELYPEMAVDSYMGYDYYGETCLHFAIINNAIDAFKVLLETDHCDVHARAKGKFFIPMDIKLGAEMLKKDDYEGFAYYGEFPLSFAASVGNDQMYDLLLEKNADISRKDKFGNTALHMTVIHNKIDMYHHAVTHSNPKYRADPSVKNKDGLTPLALAAKLGRSEMFKAILDISATKYWAYSRMICNAYPLENLDSIASNGDTDWESGLMKIIQGNDDNHLNMLEGGVVTNLLNQKWKYFAREKYLRLFLSHVIHILFLSCAVYLRPFNVDELLGGTSASHIARYVFEILTCIGCMIALYYVIREMIIESPLGFLQNIQTVPSRVLYYLGCFLILLCIPFRIAKLVNVEDWILAFAIPFLWAYFLFFARGLSLTGPFVTMIYTMIKTDILRFSIIYVIILGTSGIVFFYLFKDLNVFAFQTELGSFMTLLQMSLGEFDYDAVKSSRYPPMSIILFVVYMLMVHILLLSMLIAMMTRTYETIASRIQKEWRRQWASIVIILERSYLNKEKLHFQNRYSVPIHVQRMTSEGPADNEAQSEVKAGNRSLLWVHDRGVGSGERKAAIEDHWKKTGELIAKSSMRDSQEDFNLKRKDTKPDVTDQPNVSERRKKDEELTMVDN